MASGRLLQARGPATAKGRSPSVDLRVADTLRSDDVYIICGFVTHNDRYV